MNLIALEWNQTRPAEPGIPHRATQVGLLGEAASATPSLPRNGVASGMQGAFNVSHEARALTAKHELTARFERMRNLKAGWDSCSAPAPSDAAIVTAQGFLSHLPAGDARPPRVVPSVVGGVGVTHKTQGRRVYVEFYNDGQVYALFPDGETEPRSVRVVPDHPGFRALIEEIRDYLDA